MNINNSKKENIEKTDENDHFMKLTATDVPIMQLLSITSKAIHPYASIIILIYLKKENYYSIYIFIYKLLSFI